MAGKHVGGISNTSLQTPGSSIALAAWPPVFPGTPRDRAYAESRTLKIRVPATTNASNPFVSPTPEYYAWLNGIFNGGGDSDEQAVQARSWNNPEPPNP